MALAGTALRAPCLCFSAGVLRAVVEAASSGASVLCLCEKGDAMIMEETGKIFKKEKEMKKGEACSNAGTSVWARWVPAARGSGAGRAARCR